MRGTDRRSGSQLQRAAVSGALGLATIALFAAVAAIHYGHPRFNAAGPDPSWCVKDAGGGRPPSDDVLVLCRSRDAWDLIGGAGGNGYFFHDDYLGSLPSIQNVYPPPVSALNFFNGR